MKIQSSTIDKIQGTGQDTSSSGFPPGCLGRGMCGNPLIPLTYEQVSLQTEDTARAEDLVEED
jgi:hypothetical protein